MSTIVCQNIVTDMTTSKLKVAADLLDVDDDIRSPEFGNWGFLQTAPREDYININNNDNMESCYSHPLDRKPSFSAKSLELCTENLGSETGSDIVTDGSSIFSCSPSLSPSYSSASSTTSYYDEFGDWKKTASFSPRSSHQKEPNSCRRIGKDFPPPLTTMSGSSSLQVRRRAEGGRLIIEAVETPFRKSYLKAERGGGRLRLCFMTAETVTGELDEEEEAEEENGSEETEAEEQVEGPGMEFESEKDEFDGEINRDMAVTAAGMEKFRTPRRCNEGSHRREGLCCNWKPLLWVATS